MYGEKLNKHDTLGERMKHYESHVTETYLEPDLPLYARIDGRAFHTLTRGLNKPFDIDFSKVMQMTCVALVEETGANLGYVQSDEISLGWSRTDKAPFNGRLFKLTSVLASIAGAVFMNKILTTISPTSQLYMKIKDGATPTFDCRIFNVPNLEELVNSFIWRQNDCTKNCVSTVAHHYYSTDQLHKKSSKEMIEMINAAGLDYDRVPMQYQLGTFYHRVKELRVVPEESLQYISDDQKIVNEDGEICVVRTHIDQFDIPCRIAQIENRIGALFEDEPIKIKED